MNVGVWEACILLGHYVIVSESGVLEACILLGHYVIVSECVYVCASM